MNRKVFERIILAYSMRTIYFPKNVEDKQIYGTDTVNLYVVNSKFDLIEEIQESVDKWVDTYYQLYDKYKIKTDNFSKYIIITDNDNVHYCTKIKYESR